jgi:hypothetical protein
MFPLFFVLYSLLVRIFRRDGLYQLQDSLFNFDNDPSQLRTSNIRTAYSTFSRLPVQFFLA